ncbi:MAG: sugar phosphate isomerase/epimerase family protein [Bacteroidota bacterium]|nr:sugar phosphate isomerase/epimerase family protein [Bacteroidota bacterium]
MIDNRRNFLKKMVATTVAIPFPNLLLSNENIEAEKKYPINFFTKPLDKYGNDFMIDTLKMGGVDGLDLTVRPKGFILPEKVAEDLPVVAEMAKKNGLLLEMMVSNITSDETPHAKNVLKIAAQQGIKHYRMGYFRYNDDEKAKETIAHAQTQIQSLIEINAQYGIQGGYQNHTGNYFGAPLWDLIGVLEKVASPWISSQFDICHAYSEGYRSWEVGMEIMASKIGSLAIKDFTWEINNGRAKIKKVPLGQGVVDLDGFFRNIKTMNITAPITLHIEYPLLEKYEENLSLIKKQKIIVGKIQNDVQFITSKLHQYQLI